MKPFAALAALAGAVALTVAPAFARSGYVVDNAHMLSQNAISTIDQQVGDFNAQTGKEVVVVTEPTLGGQTPQAVAERDFAQQQVNGVMIFIAKQEKVIGVVPDTAARRFFPAGTENQIRDAIRASFRNGDFDAGAINGVGLTLSIYRSHLTSAPAARQAQPVTGYPVTSHQSTGFGMGFIWWIIILAVIFFVIRGIFRAMAGPRVGPGYGPGPGPGYGGPGGPGYGGYGPGYGGYGPGMGGGGFWSGLLGGLGGAWLGNELFRGGGQTIVEQPGTYAGTVDPGSAADAGGWQNDAGQADMGNASFGDYGGGDSGSGGGWGGGGDWGGGGGGDFGGGGGDGGGGW